MSQLRSAILNEIKYHLDESYFTINNFTLESPNTGSVLVIIKFVPEPNYYFSIKETAQRDLEVTECPGEYKNTQKIVYAHGTAIRYALDRIPKWCDNVLAELRTTSVIYDDLYEDIEKLRKSFESQLEEPIKDQDQHFTKEEIETLKSKLDNLEAAFENLQEKNAINEDELKKVKKEIENIRGDLDSFPKTVWYRTAGHKIISIIKKVISTPEARQFALEAAKKALGWE